MVGESEWVTRPLADAVFLYVASLPGNWQLISSHVPSALIGQPF